MAADGEDAMTWMMALVDPVDELASVSKDGGLSNDGGVGRGVPAVGEDGDADIEVRRHDGHLDVGSRRRRLALDDRLDGRKSGEVGDDQEVPVAGWREHRFRRAAHRHRAVAFQLVEEGRGGSDGVALDQQPERVVVGTGNGVPAPGSRRPDGRTAHTDSNDVAACEASRRPARDLEDVFAVRASLDHGRVDRDELRPQALAEVVHGRLGSRLTAGRRRSGGRRRSRSRR
ncbi:MAG: hypothetical protein ACOYLX_18525 [Burkholderiaceae bacterium]